MKHSEKLRIEVRKTKPIQDLIRGIQFHLTKKEQTELVDELLKKRTEPTDLIEKYADHRCRAGKDLLDATKHECWLLAQKGRELEEKRGQATAAWGGR